MGMIGEDGGVGHGAEGVCRAGVWREGAHRAEPWLGCSDVIIFFIRGEVRLGSMGPWTSKLLSRKGLGRQLVVLVPLARGGAGAVIS